MHASYSVAFAYVLGDTYDKSRAAGKKASAEGQKPTPLMITSALDVVSWQTMASIAIPGFAINRVVAATGMAFRHAGRQPGWAPTLLGLATIPVIVKPIDAFTDAVLDHSLRPAIEEYHRRQSRAGP